MLLFKRSIAYVIDFVLVCIVGLVLYPLHSVFESYPWTYALAFFLAHWGYHALFESTESNSPGQKVFGLRVETETGEKLSVQDALLRSLIFHLPLLLAVIPESNGTLVGTIMGGLFLFAWLANPIFILVHPDHRGLHELFSRSHVAPANVSAARFSRRGVIALGGVALAVIALSIWTDQTLRTSNTLAQIQVVRNDLQKDPRVIDTGARLNTFRMNNEKPVVTYAAVLQVSPSTYEDESVRNDLRTKAYASLRAHPVGEPIDFYAVQFIRTKFYGLIRMTYQDYDRQPAVP